MSLNKILLSTVISSFLFFNGCKNDKETIKNIKENTKEIAPILKNLLEKKVSSNSPEISLETIRNNEYLLTNIKNKLYLQNEEYLKEKINKFVESSEHTYTKRDTNNISVHNASEFSLIQLQRIYLMYEYLKDSSSLQDMGKIIEEDVKDLYAEHGGIILFNKKKIYFKTMESYVKRKLSSNVLYGAPDETFLIPNIGYFHLHAISNNEKESASPSDRDIIISYYTTDMDNESHDFLITPINRGTFNVDYYSGYKKENPIIKFLDLGNYTYDTTQIK